MVAVMTLTAWIVLIVVLCAALLGGLAFVMTRPKGLRPHRPRGGRPHVRLRRSRRSTGDPGM